MPKTKLTENERKEIIDALVGNEGFCSEEEREPLGSLADNTLLVLYQAPGNEAVTNAVADALGAPEGITANELPKFIKDKMAEEEDTEEEEEPEEEEEGQEVENKRKPTCNQQPKTDEEWLNTAPPSVRSAVQNAMAIEAEQKQQLIAQLTANLNKDQQVIVANRLKDKPLAELKDLALLAPKAATPPATLNFAGQAGAYTPPVSNGKKLEPLPLPDHDLAVANAAKS